MTWDEHEDAIQEADWIFGDQPECISADCWNAYAAGEYYVCTHIDRPDRPARQQVGAVTRSHGSVADRAEAPISLGESAVRAPSTTTERGTDD